MIPEIRLINGEEKTLKKNLKERDEWKGGFKESGEGNLFEGVNYAINSRIIRANVLKRSIKKSNQLFKKIWFNVVTKIQQREVHFSNCWSERNPFDALFSDIH